MIYSKRTYVFAVIVAILFSWIIYTQVFATQSALKASDDYHVDKLMHFLGGVLVAGVLIYYFRIPKVYSLLLLLLVGVGWEVFEILFFPAVKYFYETLYYHWLSDTRGDIILDMLGGLGYIVFYEKNFLKNIFIKQSQLST